MNIESELDKLTLEELNDLYASLADFVESPVSITEFVTDAAFIGNYFAKNDIAGEGIYSQWKKVLAEIYPSPHYSKYWLVCLRGCIGAGKTSCACAGVAYDLYKMLCMKNPQRKFTLLKTTQIVFALYNRTLKLSGDVVWDKLNQMFTTSPFFSRLLSLRKKKRGDSLFPHRIDFMVGSRIGHSLGQAIHSSIISEANFDVVQDQMYENFNSLIRRMQSRFMGEDGGLPGKIWVDSSEGDKFSTVNKIVDSYKSSHGVYVSQSALWEVKPEFYSGRRFWVFLGNDLKGAEIIETDKNESLLELEPEHCLQIPEELRESFEADLDMSIRDLAGRSTVASSKVFRLKDKMTASLSIAPLFPESFKLDFDISEDQIMEHALLKTYFKNAFDRNMPRCIHFDFAYANDRLGVASSYVKRFIERKYRDIHTMQEIVESVPEIVTEFAFGIEPTSGKEVPLFKVKTFILWLIEQGYPIYQITCDGFQSVSTLQELTVLGFSTDNISADKTVEPYNLLKNMVYQGRALLPSNKILRRELEELEVSSDGTKIDHPKKNQDGTKGSKDISDAVACSVFNASRNANAMRLYSGKIHEKTEGEKIASQFWALE